MIKIFVNHFFLFITLNKGCATRSWTLWPAERFRFWNCVANLPWVANELSNAQNLTHRAVAPGPIW